MGRDTWFYKLDKIKAREVLLPDLKDPHKLPITFKKFCYDRKWISSKGYEESIKVISEDINQINPINLFRIIQYVGLTIKPLEKQSTLDKYGIHEILYLGRDNAYAFMYHFSDLIIAQRIDDNYNIKQELFMIFVNYIIILTLEFVVMTHDIDDKIKPYIIEANRLKKLIKKEPYIQRALTEVVPDIYKQWIDYENSTDPDKYNSIEFPYDYWICELAYGFLIHFIEIKNSIKKENTNIIIIDSI
ncbi:hypothetical protein GCM10011344_05270 [Dokdonia pacifica]|uniref:Uncharacterized protein n=1 Tax=Dokdonia pacifica TaxID=1627892 RepID=A0A238ZNE3_9FLAO|nr:hypothetical protein [Dokdonia pacifica]GGG07656.1 hypothetical protein GCM10011344_05270 [Dokdonia pacifica]SNR84976.1 hypothetical protein SAMN06265376_103392 [Dokdonia pacifica]